MPYRQVPAFQRRQIRMISRRLATRPLAGSEAACRISGSGRSLVGHASGGRDDSTRKSGPHCLARIRRRARWHRGCGAVRHVTELDTVPLGGPLRQDSARAAFSPDSVVVGRSRRMRAVFDFLRVIEGSESNVLIIGETGTGKEVVARLIHHDSARAAADRSSPSAARFSPSR